MALNKNSAAQTSAVFEDEETSVDVADNVTTQTVTGASALQGAVTVAATTAVAVAPRQPVMTNIFDGLKDAFPVDFDTVPRIAASQGSFVVKGDKEVELGNKITATMISWQEQWVASPNDKKADIELVKWSDDGVTSRDGVNLKEHIKDLLEQGYRQAKIAHRVILVIELVSTKENGEDLVGELYQIDLPDSGRRAFNAYKIQASYAVLKGRKTQEEALTMDMEAVKTKSRTGEDYTKVSF